MWLAAKYPDKVISLSVHSSWHKTDPYARTVVEGWQVMAKALDNMPEMVIRGLFPWCLTPELYAAKPEYIESLANFVRSRPAQSVASFMQQSNAVLVHDVRRSWARSPRPRKLPLDVMTRSLPPASPAHCSAASKIPSY